MSWAHDVEKEIANQLKEIFPEQEVKKEWRSYAKNEDWLKFGEVYAPYPDIAVGPFNIHTGDQAEQERMKIENAFNQHKTFFQKCIEYNNYRNRNPRCLLVIEIEASKTPKYMVGDFINASILGFVGIIVVPEKLCNEALRIRKYLIGASEIKKIGDIAKNTVIIEYRQFMDRLGDGGEGKRL
jgi:hypothetical protein